MITIAQLTEQVDLVNKVLGYDDLRLSYYHAPPLDYHIWVFVGPGDKISLKEFREKFEFIYDNKFYKLVFHE